MFTIKHLDKILGEVRGFHKKSPFCPRKNLLTYRLSKMNSQYRGIVTERMVRDYYKSIGKKVRYFGGSQSFDMSVNGRRIEVKSAIGRPNANNTNYTYHFQHICANNFDKLVLVFISPEKIHMRIMDSNTVAKYVGAKKKHKSLYVRKKILGKVLAA
jgi:hypothetical protein